MSTALMQPPTEKPPAPKELTYLNVEYGVKSWLLTTDHKRIALLYLASITLMFFLGGAFIAVVRTHLMTPGGACSTPTLTTSSSPCMASSWCSFS